MTWLIVHAAATWFIVGLIWTIQSVHYPLFARVGAGDLIGYESEHTERMVRLLAIPAGVEISTGAALVWARGLPESACGWYSWLEHFSSRSGLRPLSCRYPSIGVWAINLTHLLLYDS